MAGSAARCAAAGTRIAEGKARERSRGIPDFTQLDDTALLSAREQMRAELQRLPPHSPGHAALSARYDASLDELVERAREAWTRASGGDRWTT
jgi:hypothetical protein